MSVKAFAPAIDLQGNWTKRTRSKLVTKVGYAANEPTRAAECDEVSTTSR
ncbi:MAG: hypothetical protein ACRD6N_09375 [Pyrinomonadaceae bacterium]